MRLAIQPSLFWYLHTIDKAFGQQPSGCLVSNLRGRYTIKVGIPVSIIVRAYFNRHEPSYKSQPHHLHLTGAAGYETHVRGVTAPAIVVDPPAHERGVDVSESPSRHSWGSKVA